MNIKSKFILFGILFLFSFSKCFAEWKFYASEKDGYYFIAEEASKNPSCRGMKEASQQRLILNELKYIRELCYEVSNSGKVKFVDPNKIFPFNRFEIKSDNFIRIPTKQEREAAEAKRRIDEIARSLNEMNRQRQKESTFLENPTTLIIDGEMKLCHRIGGLVDCF